MMKSIKVSNQKYLKKMEFFPSFHFYPSLSLSSSISLCVCRNKQVACFSHFSYRHNHIMLLLFAHFHGVLLYDHAHTHHKIK